MSARKKNPLTEAAIYALGTTVGIVAGTVIATYIVESMRAGGALPSSTPPSTLPPGSVVSPSSTTYDA
jgi:hypothetical protein